MKYQRMDGDVWAIRLTRGEKVPEKILEFAKREKVVSATLVAIGAVSNPTLGYYHLSKKKYSWKKFSGDYELVSAIGNLTLLKGEPFLHLHAVIGDKEFHTYGGHLKEAKAGATIEVVVKRGEIPLERAMDERIGLNLWDVE